VCACVCVCVCARSHFGSSHFGSSLMYALPHGGAASGLPKYLQPFQVKRASSARVTPQRPLSSPIFAMPRRQRRSRSDARGRSPSRARRGRSHGRNRQESPPNRKQQLADSWSCKCGFRTNFPSRKTCFRCSALPGQGKATEVAPSQRVPNQVAQRQAQQAASQQAQHALQSAQPLQQPPMMAPVGAWWAGADFPPPPAPVQTTQTPEAEMASLRATIKVRKDFIKVLQGITTTNPGDAFSLKVLEATEGEVASLTARLDSLRPPEARLTQCLGALKHKSTIHAKMVTDLATMDHARALLAAQVQTAGTELAALQAEYQTLTQASTVPPPAMVAIQQLLVSMGVGGAFDQLKAHLQGLGLDTDANMTAGTATPLAAAASPPFAASPFSQPDPTAAAAAAAAAATHSPFQAAADQAATARAQELGVQAAAAHAYATGINACAATLAQQAAQAAAEAAAAELAAQARLAAAQAEAAQAAARHQTAADQAQQAALDAAAAAPAAHANGNANASGRQSRADRGAEASASVRPSRSPRRVGRADDGTSPSPSLDR
jgi:hypothetical protein